MRKHFDLSDAQINLIHSVKSDNSLKSENLALQFILDDYVRIINQKKTEEELSEKIVNKFMEINKNYVERLRWATRTAEQNSIYLLDAINTILLKENIMDCSPVEVIESPVITTSKEILKSKLDHFKQAKEDRKLKCGNLKK